MDPNYAQPRPRGSSLPKYLGIGCLVLIALLLIGGVLAYYGIRSAVGGLVAEYSSERPVAMPEVQISEAELASLQERVREFGDAMEEDRPTEPLSLSADELNALIQSALRRKESEVSAYVRIVGRRLEGDVSIPLDRFGNDLKSRYFNGKARISVGVVGERLVAHLEDLKIGDRYVPDAFRERFSRENRLKDAYDDPDSRRFLTRLDSVEIGDGRLVLKPRLTTAK